LKIEVTKVTLAIIRRQGREVEGDREHLIRRQGRQGIK
jgi:hypothetical protein